MHIGLDVPKSGVARSLAEAQEIREQVGLPCVLRPSFTLGGTGGGIAYNREEFNELIARGLDLSPVGEVLIEESVIGWKEFELEVMRDCADNVVIICSIENFDPMGVHTGDSITVAPAQTLTDKEYQRMRDAALAIIREIGVETGGSNIQFAINPDNGRMVVIEMNPRVSRSSALASKATGFPIAKIAAKLAVGYRLDELRNDITRETPACFEPTIDYVVTKMPRWAFEKFPDADPTLTTQMKSVGETMAIGRTFKESLQKALRGLETGRFGLGCDRNDCWGTPRQPSVEDDHQPPGHAERRTHLVHPLRLQGRHDASRRFISSTQDRSAGSCTTSSEIVDDGRAAARACRISDADASARACSGRRSSTASPTASSAFLWHTDEREVRRLRKARGIDADVQAASIPAPPSSRRTRRIITPPMKRRCRLPRGTEHEDRAKQDSDLACTVPVALRSDETKPPSGKDRIMILGGGPNRIGQGIEFDYCCCQAAFALREAGYETIMVNSNPETVSTDYDTSDHLFFEPLTTEDVLNICDRDASRRA